MNRETGATAAAAGSGSLVLFVVSGVVFVFSLAYGRIAPISFGGTAPDPTAVNYVGMFVLAPAIAVVGAALPMRALGAGWSISVAPAGRRTGSRWKRSRSTPAVTASPTEHPSPQKNAPASLSFRSLPTTHGPTRRRSPHG